MNKTTAYAVSVDGFDFAITRTLKRKSVKFDIAYTWVFLDRTFNHFQCGVTINKISVTVWQRDDGVMDGYHWFAVRAAALKVAHNIGEIGEGWSPTVGGELLGRERMADPRIVEIAERLRGVTAYPWKLHKEASEAKDDCICGMVFGADGDSVVAVPANDDATDIILPLDQIKANARLIAHAPDDLVYLLKKVGYNVV